MAGQSLELSLVGESQVSLGADGGQEPAAIFQEKYVIFTLSERTEHVLCNKIAHIR